MPINLLSAPIDGQSFTILANDGSDPITGMFSQLFNVSANFGGQTYHFNIDYTLNADGGLVGNDIRLTAAAGFGHSSRCRLAVCRRLRRHGAIVPP